MLQPAVFCTKILSGDKPQQNLVSNQCFKSLLCLHCQCQSVKDITC